MKNKIIDSRNLLSKTQKFKSKLPIEVSSPKGNRTIRIEGEVRKIQDGRVYCKGLDFDFIISEDDFQDYNIFKY